MITTIFFLHSFSSFVFHWSEFDLLSSLFVKIVSCFFFNFFFCSVRCNMRHHISLFVTMIAIFCFRLYFIKWPSDFTQLIFHCVFFYSLSIGCSVCCNRVDLLSNFHYVYYFYLNCCVILRKVQIQWEMVRACTEFRTCHNFWR